MHILRVDFTRCKDCYHCNEVVEGFRSALGGISRIDSTDSEELSLAIKATQECKALALNLKYYPD